MCLCGMKSCLDINDLFLIILKRKFLPLCESNLVNIKSTHRLPNYFLSIYKLLINNFKARVSLFVLSHYLLLLHEFNQVFALIIYMASLKIILFHASNSFPLYCYVVQLVHTEFSWTFILIICS